MTDLEKQLLETFKNFAIQYDLDKKEQEQLIRKLIEQQQTIIETLTNQQTESTNQLTKPIKQLTDAMNSLDKRMKAVEDAYQDIMNVLEE